MRESLRAYLHAAVRNRALDVTKAARSAARAHAAGRAADDQSAVGMGEAAQSPLEDLERHELAVALRKAAGRLPERCRLVFTLRWESHLSYAEIAESLHISVKAVERHRQRGLERLASLCATSSPEVEGGVLAVGVVHLCIWTPTGDR